MLFASSAWPKSCDWGAATAAGRRRGTDARCAGGCGYLFEEILRPDHTVHRLGGRCADRAGGVVLWRRWRQAGVALGPAAPEQHHLAQVAAGAAIDEGHVGCDAHSIDMRARRYGVQRVQHHAEAAEVVGVEFGALRARTDIAIPRALTTPPLRAVGPLRRPTRTLMSLWCASSCAPGHMRRAALQATSALLRPTCCRRKRNCRFRLLTSIVSTSTTWRAVHQSAGAAEAAQRPRVHLDARIAAQDERLEQLASDAARANHQQPRRRGRCRRGRRKQVLRGERGAHGVL